MKDFTGMRLERKPESERNFTELALVPPDVGRFEDLNVVFGVEYAYRITAVGGDFESVPSDEVSIEPGPTFSWIGENPVAASGLLLKVTHDTKHLVQSTSGFLTILDLESNPKTGEVWAVDFVTAVLAQIIRVSPTGRILRPIIDLAGARDSALDVDSGALWVADAVDSVVVKFNDVGDELFRVSGFGSPTVVGIDQRNGDCWVGDKGRQQVVKIRSDGVQRLVSSQPFAAVQWLTVNSGDGSVWVSSKTRVIKLTEFGEFDLAIADTFTFARRIAVNENNGDIWVMNWDPSTITKYTADGQKVFELGGFARPEDVAINLFDNSCLVSDTENDRIVKVSAAGEITAVQEISFPSAIAIQNEVQ